MYEFTSLKILHEDMKLKEEERVIFPFSYNGKDFSCIFLTDVMPMRLYLATLGGDPIVFEIEIDDNYYAKPYIDNDNYKKLVSYLELKYDPNHTFKPIDFFEALNNRIPENFLEKPNYSDVLRVASKIRNIEERNKIYFCGWKKNPRGHRVRKTNLEKTRSAFGDEVANLCNSKNISSRWTDVQQEETLKMINKVYGM